MLYPRKHACGRLLLRYLGEMGRIRRVADEWLGRGLSGILLEHSADEEEGGH